MVSLEKFYEHVIKKFVNKEFEKILRPLLEDVIIRLPDEPQFQFAGMICFGDREFIIGWWNRFDPQMRMAPDMRPSNREGSCKIFPTYDGEIDTYAISIITDDLNTKRDDYVKGLIIHELSEMSYAWRQMEKEKPNFLKLSSKAQEVMLKRIFGSTFEVESAEYFEKEKKVNAEAIRLGFEKEIIALEA